MLCFWVVDYCPGEMRLVVWRCWDFLHTLDFPTRVFQGWDSGALDYKQSFPINNKFVRIVSILGMGEVVVHSLCFAVVAFMYADSIF